MTPAQSMRSPTQIGRDAKKHAKSHLAKYLSGVADPSQWTPEHSSLSRHLLESDCYGAWAGCAEALHVKTGSISSVSILCSWSCISTHSSGIAIGSRITHESVMVVGPTASEQLPGAKRKQASAVRNTSPRGMRTTDWHAVDVRKSHDSGTLRSQRHPQTNVQSQS